MVKSPEESYISLVILVGSQGLPEWALLYLIVAIKKSSVTSYGKQPGRVN